MEQSQNAPRGARRRTPFQRNRRLQGQICGALLVGCAAVFVLLGLILPDREFSESENRSLAQVPGLSALAGGTFFSELGDYVADQFPGRDGWMSVNLAMNKVLGQKEAGGVYLCADDYLMQIPGEPNEVQLARNLKAIDTFAGNHPELNVVMTVAPNAVTILVDKLPENAPVRDQRADLEYIRDKLTNVVFADVTGTLTDHSTEYLYYKTDHHWTSLGAGYAFRSIAPCLAIQPPELSTYTVYTVSTTFEGTLSAKSGSHSALDTVQIYVPYTDIDYCVTYAGTGETVSSLYSRDALNGKDHYTVFFGGNYGRVDITTTADTGRCLLLFKDSYANCFVQFLYPYFDHITMIDPRYYYDNVENVIRSEGVTDVLLLYNADTFLADSSLADTLEAGQ